MKIRLKEVKKYVIIFFNKFRLRTVKSSGKNFRVPAFFVRRIPSGRKAFAVELDYIKIKYADAYMYGGDQKLFGKKVFRSGCGMIAVCDVVLFLKGKGGNAIPFSEYAAFAEDLRDRAAYRKSSHPFGIFPRRLTKLLNGESGRRFVFYGGRLFTAQSLESFAKESIGKGLPFIVRVGANMKKLPYEITYPALKNKRMRGKMQWHYITVTGVSENGSLTFSSWGGKGTVTCSELSRHFGITGGVIAEENVKRL